MRILPAIQLTLARSTKVLFFLRETCFRFRPAATLAVLLFTRDGLVSRPATIFSWFPSSLFHYLLRKCLFQFNEFIGEANPVFPVRVVQRSLSWSEEPF